MKRWLPSLWQKKTTLPEGLTAQTLRNVAQVSLHFCKRFGPVTASAFTPCWPGLVSAGLR